MTLETHVSVKHVDLDVDHYNEHTYAFNPLFANRLSIKFKTV